jgi:hypothetical protein
MAGLIICDEVIQDSFRGVSMDGYELHLLGRRRFESAKKAASRRLRRSQAKPPIGFPV